MKAIIFRIYNNRAGLPPLPFTTWSADNRTGHKLHYFCSRRPRHAYDTAANAAFEVTSAS